MVLIALCMVVLVLMVALAIDGGAMFGERREAQNSVDGAALAAAHKMLPMYAEMLQNNPGGDVDYGNTYEVAIRRAAEDYAGRNGVVTSTLEVYFVNDDRQIVSVNVGMDRGQGRCGNGQPHGPCQVGDNGVIPWTLGAKGIQVKGTARTNSFFLGIIGQNHVEAGAVAAAYMGAAMIADNVSLMPIGIYGSAGGGNGSLNLDDIHIGQHYTLIGEGVDTGSGNWGWVNFNGNGSSRTVVQAWIDCGFNPSLRTNAQWAAWCPKDAGVTDGKGPTQHFPSSLDGNWDPMTPPIFPYYIQYGPRELGYWVTGSSGSVNASCKDFKNKVDEGTRTKGYVDVSFPFFDRIVPNGGQASYYHVFIILNFRLVNNGPGHPDNDVSCQPYKPPTATPCAIGTPCPATPTPTNNMEKWLVKGENIGVYSTTSSGRHGDLHGTSNMIVFLDK